MASSLNIVEGFKGPFVDKNGRIIPRVIKGEVRNPSNIFSLKQPQMETGADYAERLDRFLKAFQQYPILSADGSKELISKVQDNKNIRNLLQALKAFQQYPILFATGFRNKSEELISKLRDNKDIRNLLQGVYLPVILPQLESADYGKALEEIFLPTAKSSYEREFPGNKFYNYQNDELAGKVVIVPGSRQERLIKEIVKSFIVAIYFPNPFQGFSVLASRERITTLPESLILSGGFEALSAIAMYPDILSAFRSPGYDLSALSWRTKDYSLCLRTGANRFFLRLSGPLARADGTDSSGLLYF